MSTPTRTTTLATPCQAVGGYYCQYHSATVFQQASDLLPGRSKQAACAAQGGRAVLVSVWVEQRSDLSCPAHSPMRGNVLPIASCDEASANYRGNGTAVNTTSGPAPKPLVQRRRLRTELRRARNEAKLTQDQVAQAMDWSLSKVIRIETGAVGVSTNDLRALLDLYGIRDSAQTNELIELARASRQTSWWAKYRGDFSSQFLQFIEYEEAASVIRTYDPLLVPGLLQTERYADAIIRRLAPRSTPADRIQTRMTIRLTRQQLLEQSSPPTLIHVLDEAVIQRALGEKDIALDQIHRLISLARRPNISVEVVPFAAGLHPGMLESFTILEFPEPEDSDVLFVESSRDLILSHDEAGEISGYLEAFEHLRSISLGPDGTLAYLSSLTR